MFVGYVLAGDSWVTQIGRGQLVLVACALTAPTIGSIVILPGELGFRRALLFLSAFVHVGLTVFYFAAVADGSRDGGQVVWNSAWLYAYAIVVSAVTFMITERAHHDEFSSDTA